MNLENYKYIVVEGPIGVGKTSLAQKLGAQLSAHPFLEQPQENPFLEKFYRDSARYALPTQLTFLFQRIKQMRDILQTDLFNTPVISDFLLDKDPLFASLTLEEDEFNLYQQLFAQLRPQAPIPDLVIYLQAGPEVLNERIKKRGVTMENGISATYLQRLCDSYSRFFYDYETAPLLVVNTENLNPIERQEDFDLLLNHIRNMRGKREFFKLGE